MPKSHQKKLEIREIRSIRGIRDEKTVPVRTLPMPSLLRHRICQKSPDTVN